MPQVQFFQQRKKIPVHLIAVNKPIESYKILLSIFYQLSNLNFPSSKSYLPQDRGELKFDNLFSSYTNLRESC